MIDLARKQEAVLDLGDVSYPLDLAFDNDLRMLELWHDTMVHQLIKAYVSLEMLTGVNLTERLTIEESFEVYQLVFEEYIENSKQEEKILYDLEGNPLPVKSDEAGENKRLYSLVYDADYIYASFMQAYRIDLIEQQGKLSWAKFNALLVSLPESTKLQQVMKIRAWSPQKGDSAQYKEQMRRLQKEYALPDNAVY